MPQRLDLASLNTFLQNAYARDKSAKVAQCSLALLDALQRATQHEAIPSSAISGTVSVLGQTRLATDWMGQVPQLINLLRVLSTPGTAPSLRVLQVLCRVSLIVYCFYQNLRWLIGVKLIQGDAASAFKMAFRFYTIGYILDVAANLIQFYAAQCSRKRVEGDNDGKKSDTAVSVLSNANAITAIRSSLLVIQGAQSAQWIKWNPTLVSAIALVSGFWDCYSFWPSS